VQSALYAIAYPSVRLSHGWISQKRSNFHRRVAQFVYFWRYKINPEILMGFPERGHQTRVGLGKQAIFKLYASIL